jgi:hypothetical protein
VREVDVTAEAAQLYEAAYSRQLPRGYRVVLRRYASKRVWAYIDPWVRRIVVYSKGHRSFMHLLGSLGHELAHLHSNDFSHGIYFQRSYSTFLAAAKLKRGSDKCAIIKLIL